MKNTSENISCIKKKKNAIFAARNGYDGFSSMFCRVFAPTDYTKIYILKGGPGTGKSTMMRAIYEALTDNGCNAQQILCSSDPSSLDGVITELGERRIAVIDGTAPHSTDPTLPGAVEEIVDLGISFDTAKLSKHRLELSKLAVEKAQHYKAAYSLLCSAGNLQKNIYTILLENLIYTKADDVADKIISELDIKPKNEPVQARREQISAFCRDGYLRLPMESNSIKCVNISADKFEAAAIMTALKKRLDAINALNVVYPSALNEETIDRIETDDYLICSNECGLCSTTYSTGIANDLIRDSDRESYASLCEMYDRLLDLAAGQLRFASDAHFKMEQIYKTAVDFTIVDRISRDLLNKIESALLHK